MKERLFSILNLKVSESKFVFDLLSIQLFIGIANSFINIVSFTFFIHHFPATSIAYAYIVIAVVLSLLNLGYEKLEKKLSPLHLLRWIIVCSAIVLALFWTGLLALDKSVMIFSLLVLGTLFYMVTGYAYWGLVSLLFNVRESKRVFSIVGSGDIPAKLIGYVAAPLLIPVVGLNNLLLFAIGSLMVGFYLLNKLIHKKRWERISHRAHGTHHHTHEHAFHHKKSSLPTFFFKHELIFIISLLSLLSYNVFNLVDFTFVTQIKAKVQNLSTLATYIAIFFAVGRLVALVLKLAFTSRVIEGLGIISCLLITPIALAVFSIGFMIFNQEGYMLYAFGIMAMLTEVLRSAMQEPVFFILFQPLNEHQRLRGHIIAKGYMLAPSLLIVGVSLVIMQQTGVELSIPLTIELLLLNLVIWVGTIFYMRKAYARALHTSIARGIFNGDSIKVFDQTTINILLEKAETGNTTERIYALKLLEQASYVELDRLLQNELRFGQPEIKKYSLGRLEERNALNTQLLEEMVNGEKDEDVKEHAITSLCKVDAQFLRSLSHSLPTLPYNIRKNIIVLLLNQNEFTYLYKAGNELNSLLKSPSPQDRELAVDIISELKNILFSDAIEALIHDPEASVRRHSIMAACKLKSKPLLPLVIRRLNDPTDKYMALQGLFQFGDSFFEEVKKLPVAEVKPYQAEFIKIAMKVKGPLSTQFLLQLLKDKHLSEEKIIHALWSKNFQAEGVEDIYCFENLLHHYLKGAIHKVHYHLSVPGIEDHTLIKRSIGNEIWNDLTTALKVCAMLYPKKEIDRVIELAENRDNQKLYNGMEMLELVLPKKTVRQVNELFDYLLDPLHHKRKVEESKLPKFMHEVVLSQSPSFNYWTKAVCLFVCFKNNEWSFINSVPEIKDPNENIVLAETRAYVLNNIQPSIHAHH
jgi:ATP:ADP antiporter, AAA family